MGIRSIKDYQLVRVTAAGQEYAAFSQTEVRELFRADHRFPQIIYPHPNSKIQVSKSKQIQNSND